MGIFTTNWYLYKTQLPTISLSHKKRDSEAENFAANKNRLTENTAATTTNFDNQLLDAIDEGLNLLGDSSKQALYFYLQKTFKINRQDIPYKIEEFEEAIEKIFGTGAKILQIQIMKSLFKKVGSNVKQHPKQKNLTFNEYVETLRTLLNDQQNIDADNKTQEK
ncbi:MAG: hypothetical protein NWF03_06835 [Candidatus Bathyarchaeota archaeon]|nr:hypothetical protein [Candidatus Bathyarchaeota archaeon]